MSINLDKFVKFRQIDMDNLETNLEQIGLKRSESAAFLALLRLSEASATEIAEAAELERTTVYKILEDLASKGLILKNLSGKRITYLSQGPEVLRLFLNNQSELLNNIFPMLSALQNTETTKPKVSFYETLPAIREVYNSSLNAEEQVRRDIISVDNIINLLGQRFVQNHTNNRVKKKIAVRSIRSFADKGSKVERDWLLKSSNEEILREVRYLKGITFAPSIMIYDQKITMISTNKDVFALVIESHELSELMKVFFDIAWRSAKSVH